MEKILLFCCLFFVFAGCKKESSGQFSVHGFVTDESLNQPLVNATIYVQEKALGKFEYETIASTKTDANGKYSISFSRDKVENYQLVVQKDNYFDSKQVILFQDLDPKTSKEYNLSTTSYSWVRVHLLNVDPVLTDHLLYQKTKGRTGCIDCCENDEKDFIGELDTTFNCLTDGGKPYAFYYEVNNSQMIGTKDTVTTPLDTVTLELKY